jgi:excisionase family DNA binding protein
MNTAQETPLATPQQPEDDGQCWLTYHEAAALIGCSTKTVQRRVKAKEITPYLRHGSNNWWFKIEDVNALIIGA